MAVAAAFVVVLAACQATVPAVSLPVCLAREPASAADYAEAFADRRIWSGGDVGATVDLGDGRVLWLFGDTFVDGLGPQGQGRAMLRNSLVLQHGRCFALVTGGGPGRRSAPLPAAEPGEWLWPSGGVADHRGFVKITALRMVRAPGPPGWDWRVAGVDVVTLRTSDLAHLGTVHAPVTQDGAVQWGGGTFAADGHVFVYGWRADHQVVARTTIDGMGAVPWELLTAQGWSTDREQAIQPAIEQAPFGQFWVVPHGGGYLASSKRAEMDSDDVTTWWGPSPIGPFRLVGRAARTEGRGTPFITYSGRVTPLPGAGLVTVWSRNHRTHDPAMDIRQYGPRFAPPQPGAIP